ncbi:MAG: hypothetical protein LQ344_004255 [Seirophora lacunosa]|nr:MAG: hypothetical protein LQ344_004255 [Seirophora lacunosa]
MYLSTSLLSTVLLAGGALATYGADSSYGSSSSGGYGSGSSGSDGTSSPKSSPAAFAGTATPSGQVKMHVVKVSNKAGDLTFEPNNLQAAAGSMVQFQFYPKEERGLITLPHHQSHSVVQSTFDQPCEPIENHNASASGFFSGFMPVQAGDAMRPAFTIMVNDTRPIWYYCSRAKHCQDGMVGVINPPAANKSRTITSFAALARTAPQNLSPGQQQQQPQKSSSSGGSYSSAAASSPSISPSIISPSSSRPSTSFAGPSAAAPAATSVTMPLAGTNVTGAAPPSGSAGGQQGTVPFQGGAARMRGGWCGLAGLVGVVAVAVGAL